MGAPTGNYSRQMFNENLRYVERRVQQGIPWVDADDNDIQDSHYHLMRRIEQLLGDGAVREGFKCVGVGLNNDFQINGGGGTGDTAGRFYLKGNQCLLYSNITYKNIGSDEDGKSINPRITAIEYNGVANETTLTDSAANWSVGEHANKVITPDITQPGSTFTITSNTSNQLIISGDATTVAQVGDNYRVELRPPSGVDRVDSVYLNVYLDEYDCTDDPNLKHTLSTEVCAQLRLKIIQTLHIKEGGGDFPDYVDSDGNQHYTFEIARIQRYDGQDAINPGDIIDLRPLLQPEIGDLSDLYAKLNNLRIVAQDPPSDVIDVLPGVWTISDRSAIKRLTAVASSPVFAPVATLNETRYDLVSIDDAGNLQVKQGTPVVGPGDPFLDAPSPDPDKLALAFIRINEVGTASITPDDITDVREFLNIGMASNALNNYGAALWLRPHEQSTPDATVRIEGGVYTKSDRTGFVKFGSAQTSPALTPVSGGGLTRFDLIQVDDSGSITVASGSEVASPGDPLADAPAPELGKIGIAIVRVDETIAVVVEDADITDIREFINLGSSAEIKVSATDTDAGFLGDKLVPGANIVFTTLNPGANEKIQIASSGGGGGGAVVNKEEFDATENQTIFPITTFVPDPDNTLVFSGQILMNEGVSEDYTFSGVNLVFNEPRVADEHITTLRIESSVINVIEDELQTAGAGQTVFNLSTINYAVGTNTLWVFVDNQRSTNTIDYNETSGTQIEFTSPLSGGEEVLFLHLNTTNGPSLAGVSSFKGQGEAAMTGDITIIPGTNITLVQNTGTGELTINASGGSGGINELELTQFRPDDTMPTTNVELWGLGSAVRFEGYEDNAVWISFDKPDSWSATDILFDISWALTTAASGESLALDFDYWLVTNGVKPDPNTPTGSFSEVLNFVGVNGDTPYYTSLSTIKIAAANVPSGRARYLMRLTRDVDGAGTNYPNAFDLISMIAKL